MVCAVIRWTGGHPYLTLKLCDEVVQGQLAKPEEVDQLVTRAYSSLEAAESDVHFETVLRFVSARVDHWQTALALLGALSPDLLGLPGVRDGPAIRLSAGGPLADCADALSPDLLGLPGARPTNHPLRSVC